MEPFKKRINKKFNGFIVDIDIDEERGNYDMRFNFQDVEAKLFEEKISEEFGKRQFGHRELNHFSCFTDGNSNYIINKTSEIANIAIVRENVDGPIEDEIENLFNSYKDIENFLKIEGYNLKKFDLYMENFGLEDIINRKTEKIKYSSTDGGYLVMKGFEGITIVKEVEEIIKKFYTQEETTEFMLEEISNLKINLSSDKQTKIDQNIRNIRGYSKELEYNPEKMIKKIIKEYKSSDS
jgi:predicted transcriptional regulator